MTDFSIIKQLFGITEPNGFVENEMQVVKDIFGDLPKVFIDYYAELGKIESLNHTQDSLIIPERFQYYKQNEYLIFYTENQHACVWGIHKDDLSIPNPQVYMSYDQEEWSLETKTLTEFFTAMAFLQAGFALEFPGNTFYEIEQQDLDFIVKNYSDKTVSFQQWLEGIKFYGNHHDEIIIITGGSQMFYAANSKEHFTEMDEVLSKLGEEL